MKYGKSLRLDSSHATLSNDKHMGSPKKLGDKMVKKTRTLETVEQIKQELERLAEKVFAQFQPTFNAKGYELVRYLDGEIDKATSDKIRAIVIRADAEETKRQQKDRLAVYDPDYEGLFEQENISVILMCDRQAIPDWVVKKMGENGSYAAYVEVTQGIIEIEGTDVEEGIVEIDKSPVAKEVRKLVRAWTKKREKLCQSIAPEEQRLSVVSEYQHFGDFSFSSTVEIWGEDSGC